MWRFGYSDIFISKQGIVRHIKATSAVFGATNYYYIDTCVLYKWTNIKKYSYKNNKFKFYFNKGNIFNYLFSLIFSVKKDSKNYKTILNYLKNYNIPKSIK